MVGLNCFQYVVKVLSRPEHFLDQLSIRIVQIGYLGFDVFQDAAKLPQRFQFEQSQHWRSLEECAKAARERVIFRR